MEKKSNKESYSFGRLILYLMIVSLYMNGEQSGLLYPLEILGNWQSSTVLVNVSWNVLRLT